MAVSATTSAANSSSVSAVADQMAAGLAQGIRERNTDAKRLGTAIKELSILEKIPSDQRTEKQTSKIAKLKKQIGKLFRAVFGGSTWLQHLPKGLQNSALLEQLKQSVNKFL